MRDSLLSLLIGVLGLSFSATAAETATAQQGTRAAAARQAEAQASEADDPRAARRPPRRQGEITFDDLKFDIEPDAPFYREMLTEEIEALHGKTVQLRGYILPASVFQQTGIKQFVLVRDNQECCFGPGAALFDAVMIEMVEGNTATFSTRPVAVKGKFSIKEYKYPEDAGHYAVFRIEATEVK